MANVANDNFFQCVYSCSFKYNKVIKTILVRMFKMFKNLPTFFLTIINLFSLSRCPTRHYLFTSLCCLMIEIPMNTIMKLQFRMLFFLHFTNARLKF